MPEITRLIRYNDLNELLNLYRQLNPDDPDVSENKALIDTWDLIYNNPNLCYIVVEVDGKIVSSCNISIINNLTRNLRPYGLIENVITDENYRKKGYATNAINMALQIAKDNNCYKVMLLTERNEETQKFYEQVGFIKGIKTGFIKKL